MAILADHVSEGASSDLTRSVRVFAPVNQNIRIAPLCTYCSMETWTVKSNRSIPPVTVIPVLIYPDVRQAVEWLGQAFGFKERLQIGENHRAQLKVGDGAVILAEASSNRRPPNPGELTHQIMVRVEDASAHYQQAHDFGARILMDPTDFPYGERQYVAEDLAGHQWVFTETLADVDPNDWGGLLKESED